MARLEFLMTLRAELKQPPTAVGAVPSGTRQIFDTAGGHFEGPKLRGRVLESGGDWLLIGSDGIGRLDVRASLATDDGAFIYVQYTGVLSLNEAFLAAAAGGREAQYGDTFMMTQPRFETGDERYTWLNSVVAVGEGRALPGGVEYRIHSVVND